MIFSIEKRKYNILLWGSTIVEDALKQKILKSHKLKNLYTNSDFFKFNNFNDEYYTKSKLSESDIKKLVEYAKSKEIDIFICDCFDNTQGIIDAIETAGIKSIGVNKNWSKLEAYKDFGKKFMINNNIKTADYVLIDNFDDFKSNLSKFDFPVVVKANKFANGLGVYICYTQEQAYDAYSILTSGKTYAKQEHIIIEQYIDGIEFDIISLWDGKTLFPLPPLKDYKRRLEFDKGLNTGSMGQYFPFNIPAKYKDKVDDYIKKLETGLKKYKANYKGAIYSALIANDEGIYCLEYNMRIGLTEGPLFTLHTDKDIIDIFLAIINQKLSSLKIKWKKGYAACINIVSKNYPQVINEPMSVNLSTLDKLKESHIHIFHSSHVNKDSEKLYKQGCIFLCLAKSSKSPTKDIYEELQKNNFDINSSNCAYRTDISEQKL